jgi:hypothetical protein
MILGCDAAAVGAPPFLEHARLPSVSFASCYVYSPRGAGLVSECSRFVCDRVKRSDPVWLPRYAGCVIELMERHRYFRSVFTGAPVLVPVPGSEPADISRSWAAAHLAMALKEFGLGCATWTALRRGFSVRKSSHAPAGSRPTAHEHYQSFVVSTESRDRPEKIILVDDVITKGRTLFAAAARLRVILPHAEIRAFALIRTMGRVQRLGRLIAPCEGVVYWAGGDARREP